MKVTMTTTLKEAMDKLPAAQRQKVEAQAQVLIAEEVSLRDLRKALSQTRASVSEKLGINQENVSRLEQRSDLLLWDLYTMVDTTHIRFTGRGSPCGSALRPTREGALLAVQQPQSRGPERARTEVPPAPGC